MEVLGARALVLFLRRAGLRAPRGAANKLVTSARVHEHERAPTCADAGAPRNSTKIPFARAS